MESKGFALDLNWKKLREELLVEKPATSTSDSKTQKPKQQQQKNRGVKRKQAYDAAVKEIHTKVAKVESEVTEIIGLDCEYVGVGFKGCEDQLARVSIVNAKGECIYDKYVKPMQPVTDYRTFVSGIRPETLRNGEEFHKVRQEVIKLIHNKIVVGHAVYNDFRVLATTHPWRLTRDSAKYKPFRKVVHVKGQPSLKVLAEKLLNVKIQTGEHSSIVDARTALKLYMLNQKKWDNDIKQTKRS